MDFSLPLLLLWWFVDNMNKKETYGLYELIPVGTAGEFYCEEGDCNVTQYEDSKGDVLYYGNDNGMYCVEHIKNHAIGV